MEGVHQVRPNIETHPEFGQAMEEAIEAGVEIQFLECKVTKDSIEIIPSFDGWERPTKNLHQAAKGQNWLKVRDLILM